MNLEMNLNKEIQRGEMSLNDFIQNEIKDFNDESILSKHMAAHGIYAFENKEVEKGSLFIGVEDEDGPCKTIIIYLIEDTHNDFVYVELYTPDISEDLVEYKIEVLNIDDVKDCLKKMEDENEKYIKSNFEGFREEIEGHIDEIGERGERFKYNIIKEVNGEEKIIYKSERVVNLIIRSINKRFKEYKHNNLVIRDMKEKEKESLNRGIEYIYLEFKNGYMYLNMKDYRINLSEEEFYILHRGGRNKISNMRFVEYIVNLDEGGFRLREVYENESLVEKDGEAYLVKHEDVPELRYDPCYIYKEADIVKEKEAEYIIEHLENQEGQLNLLGLV